jgi:hypothetical protein
LGEVDQARVSRYNLHINRGGVIFMIRAIVEKGVIRPLDPLPASWCEGHEVLVEDAGSGSVEDLDEWYRELQALGPAVYEPGEREHVRQTLKEADDQAKSRVRREMGLG